SDLDGDGISDVCDLDNDNDGILDVDEGCDVGMLTLTFVSTNAVGSSSVYPDPADTANGIINRLNGASNDGFLYDTTPQGQPNPIFTYTLTVDYPTIAYSFDVYGTVGTGTAEQLKSYDLSIT